MTQREIIIEYLKSLKGQWIREYKLRSTATEFGFIGSQGDRRVRELIADGTLERRMSGKFREVRIKETFSL